ncbi:MAG: succinyl-diaminopimelate desuccinylase [Alphaproteobacteria bacterium]|nr:succinyl-diaminopimelate desuccinylase [Alphaproteobacteria bacterium]
MSDDPVKNLSALIRCASVTPADAGALSALETMLQALGFQVDRIVFEEEGTPPIENLYARIGTKGPHLMFAGHTDVVPAGDPADWSHPPFAAEIENGRVYGRGAVDMKGGIACFVAAIARYIGTNGQPDGSVSMLITGDEEGPSVNGTVKLVEWAAQTGEVWDGCIVGEPTNPDQLGDMIKIGRRGSLSGRLTVTGTQGHVAYPHRADNPVRALLPLLDNLLHPPLDTGSDRFQPSNLEITSIDIGNPAVNVIPAKAMATFNIRFNDHWSVDTLKAELTRRLDEAARDERHRAGRDPASYRVDWVERPSESFLTHDDRLIETVSASIEAVTGRKPTLSTTGGTSDARFIKNYCPVVEFGLVGQTMHMTDEHVVIDDLTGLTDIYTDILERWFAGA